MTFVVRFRPHAEANLAGYLDYLEREAGPKRAYDYLAGIREHCLSLSDFPHRGVPRDDLSPGIRTLSYRRRVVIAYRIDGEVVRIVRVFFAGRDFERKSFEQ
jgi:toxin ParE1/3/4